MTIHSALAGKHPGRGRDDEVVSDGVIQRERVEERLSISTSNDKPSTVEDLVKVRSRFEEIVVTGESAPPRMSMHVLNTTDIEALVNVETDVDWLLLDARDVVTWGERSIDSVPAVQQQ